MSDYIAPTTLGGTVEHKAPSNGIGPLAAVIVILLGIAVAVLAVVAVVVANWANDARGDANVAAAKATALAEHGTQAGAESGTGSRSYAGMAPANAAALAKAHKAFPAELPPITAGPMVQVQLTLVDRTIQVAPGIKYSAWAFAGGAPGPVIHVRQGQMVHVTLTNNGMMAHSVDFHSARIAPNVAFIDVLPGASKTFSFVANDPGVFMYHCGTKPVLMHIANGMYGAIVVEPKAPLPKADKEYVLVSSEWYLSSPGLKTPAQFDMEKAHLSMPDWVTWNGYAAQYVTHPLTADPGDLVRFWVVAAGPSLGTDFHIVGTILNRAYVNADLTNPANALRNVQTVQVPAGGGGVFDVKIDDPGLYPFVSHSFASVDMGQVGLLKVGDVEGTMSH